MLTPRLSRAARALIGWTQGDLANRSGVAISTIRRFEGGNESVFQSTLTLLTEAFEKAGIEFIPENGGGPGVRTKSRSPGADDHRD